MEEVPIRVHEDGQASLAEVPFGRLGVETAPVASAPLERLVAMIEHTCPTWKVVAEEMPDRVLHITMTSEDSSRVVSSLEAFERAHEVAQACVPTGVEVTVDATWRIAETSEPVHSMPVRRHNAVCPCCGGPAFEGIGLPRCEAPGGCVAWDEREPGDGDVWPVSVRWDSRGIATERGWTHAATPKHEDYATRDLAVAAWRQATNRCGS